MIDAALAFDVDLAQNGVQAVLGVADAQRVGAGAGVDENLRVGRGALDPDRVSPSAGVEGNAVDAEVTDAPSVAESKPALVVERSAYGRQGVGLWGRAALIVDVEEVDALAIGDVDAPQNLIERVGADVDLVVAKSSVHIRGDVRGHAQDVDGIVADAAVQIDARQVRIGHHYARTRHTWVADQGIHRSHILIGLRLGRGLIVQDQRIDSPLTIDEEAPQ